MNNLEFVEKAKEIAALRTLYVNGGYGQQLTPERKQFFVSKYPYNAKTSRQQKILSANANTYAFDCIGLIKGILWGFPKVKYASGGVPDVGEDFLIKMCQPSTDFKKIVVGSVVWLQGHIGIYIGDSKVIESTPSWRDGVQITGLANHGYIPNTNMRTWIKWGKLPYIEYVTEAEEMVKELTVLSNGKTVKVQAISKDGTNYIRMRDFDEVLGIANVDYDAAKKLPIINKK